MLGSQESRESVFLEYSGAECDRISKNQNRALSRIARRFTGFRYAEPVSVCTYVSVKRYRFGILGITVAITIGIGHEQMFAITKKSYVAKQSDGNFCYE